MRNTKRRLELFSFYDYTGIQAHLERMAARGWMLERMGNFGWRYRRTAPKKLRFAVTYFPGASEFDPGPAEGQDVFQDYCAEAGWRPVAKWAQMQVYCSEAENPVPMETDAATQVRTIHRAMKKNYLIGQAVLALLALLQLVLFVRKLRTDPVDLLSHSGNLLTAVCWSMVILLCLAELAAYFLWYRRAKAAAERDGGFVATRSRRRLQAAALVLVMTALLLWLASLASSPRELLIGIAGLLTVALLNLLVNLIKNTLKRKNVSAGVNRAVTLISCFVLAFVLIGGLTFCVLRLTESGRLSDREAESYEYGGHTWDAYHDPIPLRLEDLAATDYGAWSTEAQVDSSLLLTHGEYAQRARLGEAADLPGLDYEIVTVKAGFLYDLCRNSFISRLERYNDQLPREYWDEYRLTDAPAWDAEEVYQRYCSGEAVDQFLLCWPDRIAEISFDWPWSMTEDMMSAAAERLRSA